MSADNWTQCPVCVMQHTARIEAMRDNVRAAYGRLSPDAYELAREALRREEEKPLEDSMREDYDIGVRDGEFTVDYRCSCDCGFAWQFNATQAVAAVGQRIEAPHFSTREGRDSDHVTPAHED